MHVSPDQPCPLIVTLTLDPAAHAKLDALRCTYFPPERLHVGAHVTLFHALPGEREVEIARSLAAACADTARFAVTIAGVRFLGRGVAYSVRSAAASALRERLRGEFADHLTPQDRAPWQPHVTVQNKVAPAAARQTAAKLAGRAPPGPATATGLGLWRYLGGPWQAAASFDFAPPA